MKDECGGWYNEGFDCFDGTCCGKPTTCKYACARSDSFLQVYRDTHGFSSFRKWSLYQNTQEWPWYVPVIQNRSSRRTPMHRSIIAVPTSKLLRWGCNGEKAYRSKGDLHNAFRLSPKTEIIAVSIEKDPPLETFWKYRKIRNSAKRLKSLGIRRIICPDFSTAVNLPRLDNLANRRRSLMCAEEFSEVGISIVPFLAATHEFDWKFWLWFLKEHPEITVIAKEFQTGASYRRIGDWHAQWLLRLEQELGRGLHLVAVGGRRYIPTLARLDGLTIMDSNPFMKAVKRRRLTIKNHRWTSCRTPKGKPVDELLEHNVCIYEQFIFSKIRAARGIRNMRANPPKKLIERSWHTADKDMKQRFLPFTLLDQPNQKS
jgi:hypothetical protein